MHNYPVYASIILLILDAALFQLTPTMCRTKMKTGNIILIAFALGILVCLHGICIMATTDPSDISPVRIMTGFVTFATSLYLFGRILSRITDGRMSKAIKP